MNDLEIGDCLWLEFDGACNLSLGVGFICSREAGKEQRAIKWVLSFERWGMLRSEQETRGCKSFLTEPSLCSITLQLTSKPTACRAPGRQSYKVPFARQGYVFTCWGSLLGSLTVTNVEITVIVSLPSQVSTEVAAMNWEPNHLPR